MPSDVDPVETSEWQEAFDSVFLAGLSVARAVVRLGTADELVADQQWQSQDLNLPQWGPASPAGSAKRVEITLR